jgi:hypothetical protein
MCGPDLFAKGTRKSERAADFLHSADPFELDESRTALLITESLCPVASLIGFPVPLTRETSQQPLEGSAPTISAEAVNEMRAERGVEPDFVRDDAFGSRAIAPSSGVVICRGMP